MSDETTVVDGEDKRLVVGGRVFLYGYQHHGVIKHHGVITEISDPDGDVDEGRIVGINPRVFVRFDDGDLDDYSTHLPYKNWDAGIYVCDDLVAVDNEENAGTIQP